MPAKPIFNEEQHEVIHAAALRVWRKFKADKKTQEELALALGISQQSVSNLIKGTYSPGLKVARDLAVLDGKTLEQLIGDFAPATALLPVVHMNGGGTFSQLDVCLQFHASTKHWSSWTIAAARAGFFGTTDFSAPEWAPKLDYLEKTLERARKTA